MSFSSLAPALPLIQARKIRPVAVTSSERMPQLPDVAPLGDAPGLAGYELLNWFAMFAPASSSQPILARLAEVMPKIMQRPDIREQLAIQGHCVAQHDRYRAARLRPLGIRQVRQDHSGRQHHARKLRRRSTCTYRHPDRGLSGQDPAAHSGRCVGPSARRLRFMWGSGKAGGV
jgi:Tripartite tricarboxylate transporter family receptor